MRVHPSSRYLRLAVVSLALVTTSPVASAFNLNLNPYYDHAGKQLYWVNATPFLGGLYVGPADGSGRAERILNNPLSPDAVAVDTSMRHVYYTNMTLLDPNDGNIKRAEIVNGRLGNIVDIVPEGLEKGVTTPKQLSLDLDNRQLYFADREGRRVFRAPMAGVQAPDDLEVLVDFTALGDDQHQFVGIAIDPEEAVFYWTDRLTNTIWRAPMDLGIPVTLENLDDYAEKILSYEGGMLIELALDEDNDYLYFSDRGEGNELIGETLPAGFIGRVDLSNPEAGMEVVVPDLLADPVGITISPESGYLYYSTSEDGKIFRKPLDGGDSEQIHRSWPFTEGMDIVDWDLR